MKLTSSHIADPYYGSMPLYTATCDAVNAALKDALSSQESLAGNFLGRAFVSLCDTFTGLIATFVTNITKIHKKLKRSELNEFVQSNRMKVNVVCNQLKTTVGDIKVYAPAGMNVTYCEAIDTLSLIYTQLNAVETARTMLTALQEIFSQLSAGDKSASKNIASASNYIGTIVRGSKEAVLKCQKDFGSDRADTVVWHKVYPALTDISRSVNKLLAMESRLQDVHKLVEMAESMEAVVKGILGLVKEKKLDELPVNSRDLNNIGETAKSVALIFDSYSLAATRQMALEHNTVLNINALFKAMS